MIGFLRNQRPLARAGSISVDAGETQTVRIPFGVRFVDISMKGGTGSPGNPGVAGTAGSGGAAGNPGNPGNPGTAGTGGVGGL